MGKRARGRFDLYVNSSIDNRAVGLGEAVGVDMLCRVGEKLKPKDGPTCVVNDESITKWDYECKECEAGQYYNITKTNAETVLRTIILPVHLISAVPLLKN